MIDPQTTWAILADPMTYVVWVLSASNAFAVRRWWKCLKGWEAADRDGYKWWAAYLEANSVAQIAGISASLEKADRDKAVARATDLEDRLRKIERQRSETVRKGNLTRAAKRKALQDAKTNELRAELEAPVAQPMAEAA